jgi:hypothetical protein
MFETEARYLKYRKKLKPDSKTFCSRDCHINWKKAFNVNKNCSTCDKAIVVKSSDNCKNNFCSSSCAATFNNKLRESSKGKKKFLHAKLVELFRRYAETPGGFARIKNVKNM